MLGNERSYGGKALVVFEGARGAGELETRAGPGGEGPAGKALDTFRGPGGSALERLEGLGGSALRTAGVPPVKDVVLKPVDVDPSGGWKGGIDEGGWGVSTDGVEARPPVPVGPPAGIVLAGFVWVCGCIGRVGGSHHKGVIPSGLWASAAGVAPGTDATEATEGSGSWMGASPRRTLGGIRFPGCVVDQILEMAMSIPGRCPEMLEISAWRLAHARRKS